MDEESTAEASIAPDSQQGAVTIGDAILGVFLLFVAPRRGLAILFSGIWPRFLLTLLVLYSLIPLCLNQLIPPTAGLAHLFISLNKQFPITPDGFTRSCYLVSVIGLPVSILSLSVLQHLLLRLQGQHVALIEGIAGLTYSAWPAFTLFVARQLLLFLTNEAALTSLGIPVGNPLSVILTPFSGFLLMFVQLLIVIASAWGIWIWMRFIQGITDLPPERVIATCVIICASPALAVLILVVSYLISSGELGGEPVSLAPNLDHIRDSLIFHPK